MSFTYEISVEEVYGKPFEDLVIPEGYEVVDFRPPKNESYLGASGGMYITYGSQCYPKLILQKIAPPIPGMTRFESNHFMDRFNKTPFSKIFKPVKYMHSGEIPKDTYITNICVDYLLKTIAPVKRVDTVVLEEIK